MADYISNRTGEQIDDALQQMNDRLPEQWTTGQADGVDVPSTNPRYHNNAKYYAQRAGDAVSEVTGMTVSAEPLPAGSNPAVEKSGGEGIPVNLNFKIPRGADAQIVETKYQAGESGTIAPTGTWSDSIPVVPQGQFLWTRFKWNDNTYVYMAARQGADGSSAGSMATADYDADNSVKLAGGIVNYVTKRTGLSVVDGKLCITYEEV